MPAKPAALCSSRAPAAGNMCGAQGALLIRARNMPGSWHLPPRLGDRASCKLLGLLRPLGPALLLSTTNEVCPIALPHRPASLTCTPAQSPAALTRRAVRLEGPTGCLDHLLQQHAGPLHPEQRAAAHARPLPGGPARQADEGAALCRWGWPICAAADRGGPAPGACLQALLCSWVCQLASVEKLGVTADALLPGPLCCCCSARGGGAGAGDCREGQGRGAEGCAPQVPLP